MTIDFWEQSESGMGVWIKKVSKEEIYFYYKNTGAKEEL